MKLNPHSPAHPFRRLCAAAALALFPLALTSCSSGSPSASSTLAAQQAANAGNFTTTYFLGDSLTAGYQSGSLIDTSQVNGWAPLVAAQAKFAITLPLIAPPGAPAQLTLVHLSPLQIGQLPGTTTGRDNFTAQPTDVAVPGATLNDILNTLPKLNPTTGQEQLNQLVLGYPGFGYGTVRSQAQQAVAANCTTIFLWAGNNDALVTDFTGMPSTMTPVATFTTQYQALVAYLQANSPAHLVLINIPDVTAIPYLQPAAGVLAQASAATGAPVAALSALLGISAGDFVNQAGLAQVTAILTGAQKGPITDAGVLSAAEVVTARATVTSYNQVIAAQAQASGATLVDINALFTQLSTTGVTINGIPGTTAFLGGLFSLDGVHPSNTGYALVANKVIDTLNASVKTSIPDVNLIPIAAADPFYPPYPGHHAIPGPLQPYAMPVLPAAVTQAQTQIMVKPE